MEFFSSPAFWVALGQIVAIDLLLGGDNAVDIALACRKLPPAQRTALLLVRIGVKLLAPDDDDHSNVQCSDRLLTAIKTIIVADLVMSVDNVIAIAGAAQHSGEHSTQLVVLGLLISIPIIVAGSQLVIKLMARFPALVTFGGMLLGWIAGGMLVTDPVLADPSRWTWMLKIPRSDALRYAAAVADALLVLSIGKALAARKPPLGTV